MTPSGFDVFLSTGWQQPGEYWIVRRREERRWRWPGSIWGIMWAVGSRFCLDKKSASHAAICNYQRTSQQGKGGDLPSSVVAKTPCSQYRRPGFRPWSGNWTPHATTKSWNVTTKIIQDPAKTGCCPINKYMLKKDAYYQQSAEIWTPNSWSEMGANYFHIHILDHLTCFTRCCLGKLQKKT